VTIHERPENRSLGRFPGLIYNCGKNPAGLGLKSEPRGTFGSLFNEFPETGDTSSVYPKSQSCEFTLEDLYGLLLLSEGSVKGCMCMVYHSFLDDSKDKGAQRVMVSAGFYAGRDDWELFRIDWKKVLKAHKLDYFKSSECHCVNGQFQHFRKSGKPYPTQEEKDEAREVRAELQFVLSQHSAIRGVGVAVKLEDYRRMAALPEANNVLPTDPYKAALSSVMFETVKHMRKMARHDVVAFVHDQEDDFDELRGCYLAFRKMNAKTAKFMGGFEQMDDKTTAALQAADLIANHTAFLMGQKLDSKDAVIEMRENLSRVGYWDEKYIAAVLKNGLLRHGKPIPLDLELIDTSEHLS
jgi:hypothetical protein